ncbi:3'-5' exonuclease [Acinetobacter larvae]|uniref:3'-5' exonuclease n=1 Tax=Acinetobacter larvae TaxID=1789224 RepID=A0A1B2M1W7_9GAMM|nr:3'-5' exonuclease [Acinetobacter larvae]AOA59178.1 3'-5' exonuclease [Acinetobacter larvae]
MNINLPVMVFDIETVTDLKAGAHLYHLDLPPAALEQALIKLRRQESGHDFQRLALHEIVCISGLWVDESGNYTLFSFSQAQDSEAQILSKFLSIFDKRQPNLVSWNGLQFDIPVIMLRAMYHGLSAPSLFDQGEIDRNKRYNNYQNRYHQRHIDLMDVLAMFHAKQFQKLDDIARLLGFPGKGELSGQDMMELVKQQHWSQLTQYCERDVLNCWLIYLRWLLLKGQLNRESHHMWIQHTIQYVQTQPQQHDFLALWQKNASQTAFTATDFNF